MLEDWVKAAEAEIAAAARREQQRAAALRDAEEARAEHARRATVRVMKCDSCGRGIGVNGECGCS